MRTMNIELLAITPEPEALIERAARTCYQSAGQACAETRGALLARLLELGHESPFEHACATFRLAGVSRALTHQLVRHRLMSVSQQSQRYVAEDAFDYVVPPSIAATDPEAFRQDMETLRAMYARWRARKVRKEDARFVLPNACATELVITANFREFRHIFRMRCTPHAQWEIRDACGAMLRQLHARAPLVFGDLARQFGVAP